MIIKLIDGSETDTNKLCPIDSILLEKAKELNDLLVKYKRLGFISVQSIDDLKDNSSITLFYNIGDEHKYDPYYLLNKHIGTMNWWLQMMTNKQVYITSIQKNNENNN